MVSKENQVDSNIFHWNSFSCFRHAQVWLNNFSNIIGDVDNWMSQKISHQNSLNQNVSVDFHSN